MTAERWITYRYATATGQASAAIRSTMSREEIENAVREALARGGSFTLHAEHSSLIIPSRAVVDVRIDPAMRGAQLNTFDPPRHLPPGQ